MQHACSPCFDRSSAILDGSAGGPKPITKDLNALQLLRQDNRRLLPAYTKLVYFMNTIHIQSKIKQPCRGVYVAQHALHDSLTKTHAENCEW